MYWILVAFIAIINGFILYQDYRSRSVTWIFFPLLSVTGIIYSSFLSRPFISGLRDTGINILFLGFQGLILKLLLVMKNGRNSQLLNSYIGSGDILFLISASFFFPPITFLLYYTASLLFTLFCHFIDRRLKSGQVLHKTVAMAGWQALFLILFILFFDYKHTNPTSDRWIQTCFYYD